MGYKNVGKGARRIETAERDGDRPGRISSSQWPGVLGIGPAEVADLAGRDRADRLRAWNGWADQPVPAEVVVRCLPGVFGRHVLSPWAD